MQLLLLYSFLSLNTVLLASGLPVAISSSENDRPSTLLEPSAHAIVNLIREENPSQSGAICMGPDGTWVECSP
ncbi:nwd2 [Moniliophthora roreri]|nr:nwd2 [Moniliophthora roreri]